MTCFETAAAIKLQCRFFSRVQFTAEWAKSYQRYLLSNSVVTTQGSGQFLTLTQFYDKASLDPINAAVGL